MTELGVRMATRRLDLQALRALAVVAVMLNHSWPGLAPGGFLGVDVFFVVSGFLITRQLVTEHARDGGIRLGRFYARRARRLLPAATLVLVVVALATLAVVPREQWMTFFSQIGASALYVENWAILGPFAGPDPDTPVRHFWSLSVEEQFYLAWPLLILAAGALAARWRRPTHRVLLGGGVILVAVSFAAWVVVSAIDYRHAYFGTGTRAWEFAAGGVLALFPAVRVRGRAADALFWVGLAALLACFALMPDDPGALSFVPVASTVAIMVACADGLPATARGLVGWRPVQWTGDLSYSLYLWHWPVLLLAPYVTGVPSPSWFMVLLFVLVVALSWATTRFIEDPVRRTPLEGQRSRTRRHAVALTVSAGLAVAVALSVVATNVERPALADTPARAFALPGEASTREPPAGRPAIASVAAGRLVLVV